MKKNKLVLLLMILLALSPFAYLAYLWPSIPALVPMHFNASLEPDRMGAKGELFVPVSILAGVSIFIYVLFTNLRFIDPKQKQAPSGNLQKVAVVLTVFLMILNLIIISSSVKGGIVLKNFLFPALGVFFTLLGNYMTNIGPNYFAGFRLPWTLSNDDNWYKTHRLAGKLWFVGGLLIAIAGFVLPNSIVLPLFIGVMLILGFTPVVYSFRIFKEKKI